MPQLDAEFAERLASYLPEWQYERADQPQAALLYAAQQLLADTRSRMDRLPEKHAVEFLRAFGLEAAPAVPMAAYARFTAPRGAFVPADSVFYLAGDGTRLWKTLYDVQAESLTLQAQVLESSTRARAVALPPPTPENPARLFDFHTAPARCPALRLAHPTAFASRGGVTLGLTFAGAEEALLAFLADAEAVDWMLDTDGGSLPLDPPRRDGAALVFCLPAAPGTALRAVLRPDVTPPAVPGTAVTVDSVRRQRPCTCAVCEEEACTEGPFLPFGRDLGLWRCCYLACPDALALPGAQVTLRGSVAFLIEEEPLPGRENPPVYKAVMRQMPAPPHAVQEVTVPGTAWEYWNGSLWLPLPGTGEAAACFADDGTHRPLAVTFPWPADAAPCTVEGQKGYWLRWRITRTRDNGTLPRRLHIPRVQDLRFDAALRGAPVSVALCGGGEEPFVPRTPGSTAPFFAPRGTDPDRWWLRFDHAPWADSLSLFLQLAGQGNGTTLSAWEATAAGLRPLALEDETEGLAHSGLLRLRGIAGQTAVRFGCPGWWLCLQDEGALAGQSVLPRLTGVFPGSVCLEALGTDDARTGDTALPLHGGPVTGTLLTDGFGGLPPESDGDLLRRARQRQHHRERGVSPLDVEQLLRDNFRDVVRTRSKRRGTELQVAVLLRDLHQHNLAFGRRREAIARLLRQNTALPTLGLSLVVRQPNFYPVQVTVWLRCAPAADPQTQREAVRRALTRFLHPVTGNFRGDGWWFGDLPTPQELRSYLQDRLPDVQPVRLLLTARTPRGLTVDCAAVQDPFALPVSDRHTVYVLEKENVL